MPHLFISYAKKDTFALAHQLSDALGSINTVTTWMDKSLEVGKSWAKQIVTEIKKSDYVIVLISPDVNRGSEDDDDESFVLNEIRYAKQFRKPIIPIMAIETISPIEIIGLQHIDYTKNRENKFQYLVEDICKRANIPYQQPAPKIPVKEASVKSVPIDNSVASVSKPPQESIESSINNAPVKSYPPITSANTNQPAMTHKSQSESTPTIYDDKPLNPFSQGTQQSKTPQKPYGQIRGRSNRNDRTFRGNKKSLFERLPYIHIANLSSVIFPVIVILFTIVIYLIYLKISGSI